jgi:hypothetical protein
MKVLNRIFKVSIDNSETSYIKSSPGVAKSCFPLSSRPHDLKSQPSWKFTCLKYAQCKTISEKSEFHIYSSNNHHLVNQTLNVLVTRGIIFLSDQSKDVVNMLKNKIFIYSIKYKWNG